MANQGQHIAQKAGEITGQAQMKKDEFLNQASHASHDHHNNPQNPSMTSQATNFIQQTGEQVKNMAQGAAEAVKSTLGMNPDNTTTGHHNSGGNTHPSSGNTHLNSGTTHSTGGATHLSGGTTHHTNPSTRNK